MWERFKNLPAVYKAGMLFIGLMLLAMVFGWYDRGPANDTKRFTPAVPIQGTQNIPKEEKKVANGTVKVVPKKDVGKKIPLPPEVANNDDIEITDTADTPPTENGTEVISTINTRTGDSEIFIREKDAPFFAFENKRRIGVGYGITTDGPQGKVFGEYTFLRIANAHLSAQAEITAGALKGPEAKAFAVIDYRW